jgi:hypothetical protein
MVGRRPAGQANPLPTVAAVASFIRETVGEGIETRWLSIEPASTGIGSAVPARTACRGTRTVCPIRRTAYQSPCHGMISPMCGPSLNPGKSRVEVHLHSDEI